MDETMRAPISYLALTVLMHLSGTAYAQIWFPDEAQWHHEYYNGSFVGFIRMQVEGDTLLGGEEARTLSRSIQVASVGGGPISSWSRAPLHVHEVDGLVSIWLPDQSVYDTLYHMNAVPGDQWGLAAYPTPLVCDPESYVTVVDTGHFAWNGADPRWLAVDIHYFFGGAAWDVQRDTIIERVGSTLVYFAPHDLCNGQLDGADGGPLRCYEDLEVTYNRIEPWSCGTLLSVPSVTEDPVAMLIPDGEGRLRVQLPMEASVVELHPYDGLGRTVFQRTVRNGDAVQPGRSGPLLYRITKVSGDSIGTGKVMVY